MVMKLLVPENTGNCLIKDFSIIFLSHAISCQLMAFITKPNSEGELRGSLRTYFDSPDKYTSKLFFMDWC
jgi:hypothetical protein